MVADCIIKAGECPVMKEGCLQRYVSEGRSTKFVAIPAISGYLFQAKVLILARSIKNNISFVNTKQRCDLRDADVVHLEVAEHFVSRFADCVTKNALALSKENQSAFLFVAVKRLTVAAGVTVYRGVGKHHGELKLGDCSTKH